MKCEHGYEEGVHCPQCLSLANTQLIMSAIEDKQKTLRLHRDDLIALMAAAMHAADQIAKNSEMELPERYVDWATGIYDATHTRKEP